MTGPSRRTVLCSAAGLAALSAGCLGEAGVSDAGNEDENESGSTDDPGTGGNGNETAETGDEAIDTVPFSYPAGPDSGPDAALLVDADDATDWLNERGLERDRLTEFVDATDFETAALVGVEADAPNPCYDLALEDHELEGSEADDAGETNDIESADGSAGTDATLELETAVTDDSEAGIGCTQVLTVVGRLVRAPIADDLSVSVTIVDRNGNEHGIGMAADSASESASGGERANESDA